MLPLPLPPPSPQENAILYTALAFPPPLRSPVSFSSSPYWSTYLIPIQISIPSNCFTFYYHYLSTSSVYRIHVISTFSVYISIILTCPYLHCRSILSLSPLSSSHRVSSCHVIMSVSYCHTTYVILSRVNLSWHLVIHLFTKLIRLSLDNIYVTNKQ